MHSYFNYPPHKLSVIKHVRMKLHQSVKPPHQKEFAASVTTSPIAIVCCKHDIRGRGGAHSLSIQDDGKIYVFGSRSSV